MRATNSQLTRIRNREALASRERSHGYYVWWRTGMDRVLEKMQKKMEEENE